MVAWKEAENRPYSPSAKPLVDDQRKPTVDPGSLVDGQL